MKKPLTVIVISKSGMGHADEALSKTLLINYLKLLESENKIPTFILFYGEGVKTVTTDSPYLELLKQMENKGSKLIACKTCLNYYEILDKVEVGEIGTMLDIIEIQWGAEKVITL